MARRRSNYGQEKRAKEIARKKKNEEKAKRRQTKGQEDSLTEAAETAETAETVEKPAEG